MPERVTFLFLLVGCAALAGCTNMAMPEPQRQAPVVTVSHPTEAEVVEEFFFEGHTAAVSAVDVRARVTGYLSKIYFKDGEDVAEGAPLFLIDPRPYQADLDQAQAELARVDAQLKRLDSDFKRAERLLSTRAISQEDFDKIAADRAATNAEYLSRKAAVEQNKLNIEFAHIRAPIAGRISRRLVTEGNLILANQTLLTNIVTIAPIYAYFDVDEPTVLKVRQMIREGRAESARDTKLPIYLALDIEEGYPHEGYVDFIENRVDPQTGTLRLRGVFANKKEILTPGYHARIRMPIGKPFKALVIAERAVGTNQGEKYVYLVNDQNKVVYRTVKVGKLQEKMRVISEGLTEKDLVITNGVQRVREGVTVQPEMAEAPAETATASGSTGSANVVRAD